MAYGRFAEKEENLGEYQLDRVAESLVEHDLSRWPWFLLGLIPPLSWVTPFYVGKRLGSRAWVAGGIFLGVAALFRLFEPINSLPLELFLSGLWPVGLLAGGFAHYQLRQTMTDPVRLRELAARQRISGRARARELARDNPGLAREMQIGRSQPEGEAFDLLDINNASTAALRELGLPLSTVESILAAREQLGGFSSAVELGMELDLPAELVTYLEERTVYLPRSSLSS